MVIWVNELFSIIKPEWLRALREKVFYKNRMLGATKVFVKTHACWEQTEMMLLLCKTKYCPSGRPNNSLVQPHYLRWVGLDRKLVCLNRKIPQYAIGVAMAPELSAAKMKGHT